MEQLRVSFKELKGIPLLSILERYHVHTRPSRNHWVVADCPLPTHHSPEKGSFKVNTVSNIWLCASASCQRNYGGITKKKTGDGLDLVRIMEKCQTIEAAHKLTDWFPQKKAPQNGGPGVPHGDSGSQSHPTPSTGNGKGYMKVIDEWFEQTIRRGDLETDDEAYYHRIKNAIKTKLLDSYRAGKAAAQPPAA